MPMKAAQLTGAQQKSTFVLETERVHYSNAQLRRGDPMKPNLGITDFQRIVGTLPEFSLEMKRSALLVIDMHYLQVHRDFGYAKKARQLWIESCDRLLSRTGRINKSFLACKK